VHAFVQNQGDAWTVSGNALDRFIDERKLVGTADATPAEDEKAAYRRHMAQIGKRVAELHVALASRDDVEDFKPAPFTPADVGYWMEAVTTRAERVFERLKHARLSEHDRAMSERLLAHREPLRDLLGRLL